MQHQVDAYMPRGPCNLQRQPDAAESRIGERAQDRGRNGARSSSTPSSSASTNSSSPSSPRTPPACSRSTGSAPTPRRCCSSRRETILNGCAVRLPGHTCARPPPSRHHRARPSATGLTPAATARPTMPCSGLCSPAWAQTRPHAPMSNAAPQKENPRPRSSAASSVTSPTRYIRACAPSADAKYPEDGLTQYSAAASAGLRTIRRPSPDHH